MDILENLLKSRQQLDLHEVESYLNSMEKKTVSKFAPASKGGAQPPSHVGFPIGKHYATIDDGLLKQELKHRKYEMLKHSVDLQMNEIVQEYEKIVANGNN